MYVMFRPLRLLNKRKKEILAAKNQAKLIAKIELAELTAKSLNIGARLQ